MLIRSFLKLQRNLQRKKAVAMLFKGGVAAPPHNTTNNMSKQVNVILEQADIYGLRGEVRATAMAIVKEDPTISTGSAYAMAAYEWDIL
jgi:hypothetical protein